MRSQEILSVTIFQMGANVPTFLSVRGIGGRTRGTVASGPGRAQTTGRGRRCYAPSAADRMPAARSTPSKSSSQNSAALREKQGTKVGLEL